MISQHKMLIESNPGGLVLVALKCAKITGLGDSKELRRLCIIIRDVTGMSRDAKSYFSITQELFDVEKEQFEAEQSGDALLRELADKRWEELQNTRQKNYHGIRILYGMAWMKGEFPNLHNFLANIVSSSEHLPRNPAYPQEPIICETDKKWFFGLEKKFPTLAYGGNVIY